MLCWTQGRGGDRERKEPAPLSGLEGEMLWRPDFSPSSWHGDGQRRVLGELPGSDDFSMSIKGGRLQWGSPSLLCPHGVGATESKTQTTEHFPINNLLAVSLNRVQNLLNILLMQNLNTVKHTASM